MKVSISYLRQKMGNKQRVIKMYKLVIFKKTSHFSQTVGKTRGLNSRSRFCFSIYTASIYCMFRDLVCCATEVPVVSDPHKSSC